LTMTLAIAGDAGGRTFGKWQLSPRSGNDCGREKFSSSGILDARFPANEL
jgi:hypothetical protein